MDIFIYKDMFCFFLHLQKYCKPPFCTSMEHENRQFSKGYKRIINGLRSDYFTHTDDYLKYNLYLITKYISPFFLSQINHLLVYSGGFVKKNMFFWVKKPYIFAKERFMKCISESYLWIKTDY